MSYQWTDGVGLMSSIDELPISVRTRHAFEVERIEYVWQLVQRTPAELMRVPNFGRKSLKEVEEEILRPLGLSLSNKYISAKSFAGDYIFIHQDVT